MRRWDIFCKVVDNYGDIGVCWRLAQQLACEHGADVRLWVDDLGTFARLCPSVLTNVAEQTIQSIRVCHWRSEFPTTDAADVVIEAFACELPGNYIAAMAGRSVPPVWINLEYLSAESWVEGCHLMPSPHPTLPLTKYFFFPGFTPKTGGLLREKELLAERAAFDSGAAAAFWQDVGVPPPQGGELRVSLFCYRNDALPELLHAWSEGSERVTVLAMPGAATEQIAEWFGQSLTPGDELHKASLTVHELPLLLPASYDRLLWACDVNFVRGEDSFVRAQWAQRPFVWQIYPQADDAHIIKLKAFLRKFLEKLPNSDCIMDCWQAWNGLGDMRESWPKFVENRTSIQQHGKLWASQLDQLGNLANNLSGFVYGK